MNFKMIFSPFGMVRLHPYNLACGMAVPKPRDPLLRVSLSVWEVQAPYAPPNRDDKLAKQFQLLLESTTQLEDVEPPNQSGDLEIPLISVRERTVLVPALRRLEGMDPDTYAGNVYRDLMRLDLLPASGRWKLVQGIADSTPKNRVSNATRWALQVLLLRYWLRYGAPNVDVPFLYAWHDVAFQFAGQSQTIQPGGWKIMQWAADHLPTAVANTFGVCGIQLANQPDGTIPLIGIPIRWGIDRASLLMD